MTQHIDPPPLLPVWFVTLVAGAIGVAALWYGRGLLLPLAIAGLLFTLASAVDDQCRRLVMFGWTPPSWMARIVTAAMVAVVLVLFGFVVSAFVTEMQMALPIYQERLSGLMTRVEAVLPADVVATLQRSMEQVEMGHWITGAATQVGGGLVVFGLVALYLGFLVSERSAWSEKIACLWSTEAGAARTRQALNRIAKGIKQYMWVNAVTSALSAAIAFVIFSLIGLDFAAMLALVVFLAGFIPTVGAFIGLALPALVALAQFDSLVPFLIVLLGYGLADQVIANVLQPSLQGKSLNLSTFMVVVSLSFWGTIWGGIGAFLAVPMTVLIMVICAEIPQARWIAILLSSDGLRDHEPASTRQMPEKTR